MFLFNTKASRFADRTDCCSNRAHSISNVPIAIVYAIVDEQKKIYQLFIHTHQCTTSVALPAL